MTEFEIFKMALERECKKGIEVWGTATEEAGITLTNEKITFYFHKGKLDFVENEKYEDY